MISCSSKRGKQIVKSKSNTRTRKVKCFRTSDKKVFELPREYSYDACKKMKQSGRMGFTQRSSCAPWFSSTHKTLKGGKKNKKKDTYTKKFPKKYIPKMLSKKDKLKQKKELLKSRDLYTKGVYYSRKPMSSYPHKTSKHILNARKIYDIESIQPSKELSKKSGCSIKAMKQIVKKGMGAMYSSGSRPSQTAHSWAYARLASALTGGKSASVDFHIIEKGCNKDGIAYTLALKAKKKHGKGTRKVPKIKI